LGVAYSTEELIEYALKAINEEDCTEICEVCLYMPCSKATFYNHELDKLDVIKEALDAKRIQLKKKMRRNWRNSDNATLQIADFKLMATDAELEKLTINKVKTDQNLTIQGKPTIAIEFHDSEGESEQNG
jgi:hypothetical protein